MELQQESLTQKNKVAETKPKGSPLDGRPKNSKDKTKRKQKRVLPKTKGEQIDFVKMSMWVEDSHKKVSEILSKAVLDGLNKKNLRMLTEDETNALEELKFAVFSNLTPFDKINEEKVYSMLEGVNINESVASINSECLSNFMLENDRHPTTEEKRRIQISSYILNFQGED